MRRNFAMVAFVLALLGTAARAETPDGLGLEYGFTPNWSVKGEYLYTKVIGTGVSSDSLNTLRAGINYRF